MLRFIQIRKLSIFCIKYKNISRRCPKLCICDTKLLTPIFVPQEGGSCGLMWSYRSVHIVGDAFMRDMFKQIEWPEKYANGRPHLHCKSDLTFLNLNDFIKETIPPSLIKKESMLVVCYVGLFDVVRILGEHGVLMSLEIVLADMKKCRKEFKAHFGEGDGVKLLFADLLPVDLNTIASEHKDLLVGACDNVKELLNTLTLKLVKFCYLLSRNMMVEGLSRDQMLPCWDLYPNPAVVDVKEDDEISLPLLEDGFNPGDQLNARLGERLFDIFTAYNCNSHIPPYDDSERTVYFVCNEKYSALYKFWPKKKEAEKPVFIFLPSVKSSNVVAELESRFPLPGKAILVIWFDITEVLVDTMITNCSKHLPMKLPMPCFQPSHKIFDGITAARKKLEERAGTLNVAMTTLCPIDFKQQFRKCFAEHKLSGHTLEEPEESVLDAIGDYHLEVVDRVNLLLKQSNRLRGMPSWDLCSMLYKRDKKHKLAFENPLSPSTLCALAPPTVAKIMMTIALQSKETSKSLNWMSHHYKKGPYKLPNPNDKRAFKKYPVKNKKDPFSVQELVNKGYMQNNIPMDMVGTESPVVNPNNELSQYFLDHTPPNYSHQYQAQQKPSQNSRWLPPKDPYQLPAGPPPPPAYIPAAASQPSQGTTASDGTYVPKFPASFYQPTGSSTTVPSAEQLRMSVSDNGTTRQEFTDKRKEESASKPKPDIVLPPSKRKKISFGIKAKEEEAIA